MTESFDAHDAAIRRMASSLLNPLRKDETMNTNANAVEALDATSAAYEAFQEALASLGQALHDEDPSMWARFDAYPGWDGTRDVGAGQDMLGWLREVSDSLGASGEEDDTEYEAIGLSVVAVETPSAIEEYGAYVDAGNDRLMGRDVE